MSEIEILKRFSKNLREMLKENDMKQEELANEIGVSQQTVSRYVNEQSMPSILTMVKISEVLFCSIDDLLD